MKPLLSNLGVSNRRSRGKLPSSRTIEDPEDGLNEKSSNYKRGAVKNNSHSLSLKSWSRLQFLKCTSCVKYNSQLIWQVTTVLFLTLSILRIHYVFVSPKIIDSSPKTNKRTFIRAAIKNTIHPRTFGYYFDITGNVIGFSRFQNNAYESDMYKNSREAFSNDINANKLKSSKKYRDVSMKYEGTFINKDCVQLYDWQLDSFPTCNNLHEVDILKISSNNVTLLGNGNFRDVWSYTEYNGVDKVVFKTLRYKNEFTKRNNERHNRDAIAMDRLTKSPNVVDIFGFCGNSGLFEYASHGDMEKAILSKYGKRNILTNQMLMQLAIQVSLGIADLHSVEEEPSIVHTDISPAQFIFIDGHFKLNDFNRCRFLRRNVTSNGICGFTCGNNPGRRRSPEEYKYENENEKVDVFSMGHIFYSILTGELPFIKFKHESVYRKVAKGELPELDEKLQQSVHPLHVALKTAMKMCFTYESVKRPSAREVSNYLVAQYDVIYPLLSTVKR